MWDDAVITNVGKTLLAQWAAGGTFNIDSAAAGTGTVNASLLMAQTGLVAQKQTMSIVKSEKITGGVRLQLQLTNKGVSAQYTINQIGVWGSLDDGATTMMAIFQDDDGVVVPAEADTPEYVFTVYVVLQMDNTGTLTVTLDSSVAVSQEQLNELEQKVESLDATDISLSVDGVTGKTVAAGIEELAEKVGEIEGALQDVVDGKTNVANATVTLGASLTFNGSAQTQTITSVNLNGDTLAEGTDYEISGNIATNAGNYTLIVSGKGDYTGFVFVDWSIAKAQGSISVSESEVEIIGLAGTQKQVAIAIENSYGDFVVSSSAPSVVTAGTSGNVITLTLVSEGNATITINMVGNYQASATISVSTFAVSPVLSENSPAVIRKVADNDLGANCWAVGDTYPVPLNGTVGTVQYDNLTVWAYILGFNHNEEIEGEHLIHFGCFKTAQTDGIDICLVDSHYADTSTGGEKWFNMQHSANSNSGGWKGCNMRYDILGSTDTDRGEPTTACATYPVPNTLMAAFPAALRAVMCPARKYTDNSGDQIGALSQVTPTQDYMPLLAEFEVLGFQAHANENEKDYQKQYAYYANGNSKIKYKQPSTRSAAAWWCRSPVAESRTAFCFVSRLGIMSSGDGDTSWGVAPIFFI